MKKILLSVATLLVAGVVSAQTATEVNTKFNEAATLLNEKNYAGAVTAFEETISMAQGSDEDVTSTLSDAQKYLVSTYITYGKSIAAKGSFDESLVVFQKAYDLASLTSNIKGKMDSENMLVAVYSAQGSAKLKAEDNAGALEIYEKAVAISPKNTKTLLTAAQLSAKTGDLEKAGTYYESIIALGESHSKYQPDAEKAKAAYTIDLINTAVTAPDYDTAEASLNKILSFDPESATALSTLVKTANNYKKYDVVIANADKAIEVQTEDVEKSNLNFLAGVAYEVKENTTKAVSHYKQVTAGDNAAAAKAQISAISK
ncbi:MAG: tetratricopeptide repeat protein [Rikenellaceae bacterium]